MKAARTIVDWGAALRRIEAARYCGHSPGHFDKLVKSTVYPHGRDADGVVLWLRCELDTALAELPPIGGEVWSEVNSCDEVFDCT